MHLIKNGGFPSFVICPLYGTRVNSVFLLSLVRVPRNQSKLFHLTILALRQRRDISCNRNLFDHVEELKTFQTQVLIVWYLIHFNLVIILSILRISNPNKDGMLSCSLRGNPRPQIEWYYNKVSSLQIHLNINPWWQNRTFRGKIGSRKSCEWLPEIHFLSKARPTVWSPKFLMIFLLYFCIQVTTG